MTKDKPFRANERPDEVVETPFYRMERSGRFIKIETNRTAEQQADLVASVIENRHRLVERATECRAELKALLHRFSSLDILGHQIAQDILRDPNEYREIDTELRPHLIEYLNALVTNNRARSRFVGQPEVEKVGVPPVGRLEIGTVFGLCLRWFCRISCLPDVSLVPAAHVVTQPEIRFVDSVVQKLLVPTFRADWLLCQVVLSFLIRDYASRGATQPIYGLRDDG
jgi:hypothetical protein